MDTKALLKWYQLNARPLPWRESRDPYQIWISEIMLQQTTVKAVIPYFERFIQRFPNVEALARAPLGDVYMNWAGLGYYSRARNLHAAAKIFEKKGFAKSYVQLLEIPGLGPYTARAVASFSFSEAVGVLDGNVIRFLSRYHAQKVEWWKPKDRAQLQSLADEWVIGHDSHDVNQALIEIGATICLPKNPACLICPVMKTCKSFKNKMTSSLPLQKPRRKMEMWMWEPILVTQKGKVAFTNDHGLPVLKKQLALPGPSRKIKGVPKEFDFKHTVTHHQFYVKIKSDKKYAGKEELEWLHLKDITRKSPTSLIKKVVEKSQNLSQKLASLPSAPFKR